MSDVPNGGKFAAADRFTVDLIDFATDNETPVREINAEQDPENPGVMVTARFNVLPRYGVSEVDEHRPLSAHISFEELQAAMDERNQPAESGDD